MARKSKPIIKGSFTQRQPDGTQIGLEFHGVVDTMIGNIEDVAAVVLEGESMATMERPECIYSCSSRGVCTE